VVKVINNRVYMECEVGSIDAYMKEFEKIVRLFPDKNILTIWDQSKQEEKLTDDEFYDIYVLIDKIDDTGTKVFDRAIWAKLVAANLNRTQFLQIGCWKSQASLINEIESVCQILRIEEYGDQIEFFVEFDELTREYITNEYLDTKGLIKWFSLGLYSSNDKNSIIFSSSHFGEENYIIGLSAEEVEKAITIVENNHVYIRINRHQ
jgi:hypothetical protein